MKAFSLRSGTRQEGPFSPLLFNMVLEVLAKASRQEKERNSIQIWKEEVILYLFTKSILYVETPKTSTKNLLELVNSAE